MPSIQFTGGNSSSSSNTVSPYLDASGGIFISSTGLSGTSNARLNIYRGSIENFSTFTNVSSRSSDLLVTITMSISAVAGSNVTVGGMTYYRFTTPTISPSSSGTAVLSGTASWFLLYNINTVFTPSGTVANAPALIGTVGATGSGADLELESTNIVSGTQYGVGPITINFPLSWEI